MKKIHHKYTNQAKLSQITTMDANNQFQKKESLTLRKWINLDKICWYYLCRENPNAIHLLEANPRKIDWGCLSQNPNAIPLLEANQDKIHWGGLSQNSNAIPLLKANQDKIHWDYLSQNPNIFTYECIRNDNSLVKPSICTIDINPTCESESKHVELEERINSLEKTIKELTLLVATSFDELREKIKDTTSPPHEFIKRIEYMPVYDYELIKERHRLLHQEYSTVFKFFSRLIRMRYDMPVAIAVK